MLPAAHGDNAMIRYIPSIGNQCQPLSPLYSLTSETECLGLAVLARRSCIMKSGPIVGGSASSSKFKLSAFSKFKLSASLIESAGTLGEEDSGDATREALKKRP